MHHISEFTEVYYKEREEAGVPRLLKTGSDSWVPPVLLNLAKHGNNRKRWESLATVVIR